MSVTREQFEDAVRHTFIQESPFQVEDPEFWRTNPERFPCQYDHHPFDGPVYSIPLYKKGNNRWIVTGFFCSPHCAKKYMIIHSEFPTSCYTLFSLMMAVVYNWTEEVVPASDIVLTLNPREPLSIEAWRALPRQHVYRRLIVPHMVPFQIQSSRVISYVMEGHPAYQYTAKWNATLAEPGLPEEEAVVGEKRALEAEEEEEEEDEEEEDFE